MKNVTRTICVLLLVANAVSAAFAIDQEKANINKMRDQIHVLESVLNQTLTRNFPAPFAYLDTARGAYLPGYGVVFTFELNLSKPSMGPFDPPSTPQSERAKQDEAKHRRDLAKQMSEGVIADFGHSLDQLGPNESLAIVIHGSAVGQQGIEQTTTVLRAQKRDIDQFRANAMDRAAFLRKVEVLEY
jgi:hypothetical protein